MKKTLYLNKVNKIKIDKICKNQTKAYKIKKMIKYRSLIKEIRIKKKNKNILSSNSLPKDRKL